MKKVLFLTLLFMCHPSYSQMVDMMGTLGIQGALTAGEVQSVGRGLSAMKKNQILGDITQTAMEIKTTYMGNYSSVSKYSVSGNPFSGLDWDLSSLSSDRFYIQLNQIDSQTCSSLLSARVPAIRTELNGQSGSRSCSSSNQIRFIFD